MEPFTLTINEVKYHIGLHSAFPRLFDVSNKNIYYTIGKTDAGNWVYVKHEPASAVIPLEEIGAAIDAYISDNQLFEN